MNARTELDVAPPTTLDARPPTALARWRRVLDASLGWWLCAWTFLLGCTPLKDADVWWHLCTGREILARGAVPRNDWFIYTDVDRPWTDLHWGFQVLAWLAYRAGGVDLVLLIKAAVVTTAVGLAWSARRRGAASWLQALLWLVPLTALSGRMLERPESFSLCFLACWLFVLARAGRDARWLWCLPAIQLMWTNTHGLFVLGPLVGVAWCIDRFVRLRARESRWLEPAPPAPSWKRIGLVALLTVGASLVNPYGVRALWHPFVLYRKFSVEQEFYSVRILEFVQPLRALSNPAFATTYLYAALALFGLVAASFVLLAWERRTSVFRLLLCAAFGYLFFEAVRNINLFALTAGYVLCANVAEWLELRRARVSSEKGQEATLTTRASPVPTVASAVCLIGLSVGVVSGVWERTLGGAWGNVFRLGELPGFFAHDALRFAGRPGMPRVAFVSHIGHASTFIYHHGPERRVFLDANLEVGTQQTFEQYEEILRRMRTRDAEWETLIRAGQDELPVVFLDALNSRREIRGVLASPGWRLVYADGEGAVFLPEVLAAELELSAVDPRSLWWFNARPARASAGGDVPR